MINPFAELIRRNALTRASRQVTTAIAVLLLTGTAMASSIQTFSGQDSGAAAGGPFPNSAAAQGAFEAAAGAFGPLGTITFEGLPVGYTTPFTAASGVTVSLTGPNYGPGFSGIGNTTIGNQYGFNTTPGGSQWVGFPDGSATFDFAAPTDSFGLYLTGLQSQFSTDLTIQFADGSSEVLAPPVTEDGGAEYFGFTDTSAFRSVTITDPSTDAFGIDDVTYNTAMTVSTTPEPSSFLLLGTGVLAMAGVVRRRLGA